MMVFAVLFLFFFFFIVPASTYIYTLSLHDALPILRSIELRCFRRSAVAGIAFGSVPRHHGDALGMGVDFEDAVCRSEEHTSELQSLRHLVCRLLLDTKQKELNKKK